MANLDFRYERGGICLPGAELWLDAHQARPAPDRVFVSHAHADHVARHHEVILSEPTARLMAARLGGERIMHVLPWGETRTFAGSAGDFRVTLLPAGHILGSAMSLIERGGETLLYTGDFKLRPTPAAEPCQPRRADVLIMETTFGRPAYEFPPEAAVFAGVIRFCRETLDNAEIPVLLGYSLGKSQEILCGLAEAGLPVALHPQVLKLTEVYTSLGIRFPAYEALDPERPDGRVILCPPNAGLARLRKAGRIRTAVLTGWAVDAGARFRYGADAAFALSDHADFPELVEFVKRVGPRRVYTLHGFAADFAQTLRELGFDARALSEPEQLGLLLGDRRTERRAISERTTPQGPPPIAVSETEVAPPPEAFRRFATTCATIANETSRERKTAWLAAYLRELPVEALGPATEWVSGTAGGSGGDGPLGIGWAQVRDAACAVCQAPVIEFRQLDLAHGDAGETTAALFGDRTPDGPRLTLTTVRDGLEAIRATRASATKRVALARLLARCDALEARWLIKVVTDRLRIGLHADGFEEALAAAFRQPLAAVRHAHALVGRLGEVAILARNNALESVRPEPFRPLPFAVALFGPNAASFQAKLAGTTGPGPTAGWWVEDKPEGLRCQLHKAGARVALYSFERENVTDCFPELAEAAQGLDEDVILDGEIVLSAAGHILPPTGWRKRRCHCGPDLFPATRVRARFLAFDLLWRNGDSLLAAPLHERRAALETVLTSPPTRCDAVAELSAATVRQARSPVEIASYLREALARGKSGVVVKDPESAYLPGLSVPGWWELDAGCAAPATVGMATG